MKDKRQLAIALFSVLWGFILGIAYERAPGTAYTLKPGEQICITHK
jgi:hypothetical protein